jgi:hypothetical protein
MRWIDRRLTIHFLCELFRWDNLESTHWDSMWRLVGVGHNKLLIPINFDKPCAPTNKINSLSANWRRSASQNLALDNAWATSFFTHYFL